MNKVFIILISVFLSIVGFAQEKIAQLPPELYESSSLIKYENSFLSINDSDNEPIIFVFDKKGKITHTCFIKNIINWDWEALAYDGEEFLYIGNIGNNTNSRKDLIVYKVKMNEILEKDTIDNAIIISFSYPEQKLFPPEKDQFYYDAEALIVRNDSLLIFTKNRTKPYDGISKVYRLPTSGGQHEAQLISEIHLEPSSWLETSITDATLFENKYYFLTYSKIYIFTYEDGEWKKEKEYQHDSVSQKEGIATDGKYIYMTDEYKEMFGGNYLYQLKIRN